MKKSSKLYKAQATRNAIDSYPGGLCFCTPGGRPILVNRKMNSLINALTGHIMIECNETWNELKSGELRCKKIEDPDKFTVKEQESGKENLFFRFEDDSCWHFQRASLSDIDAVQITAIDITELYHMSRELYRNNQQLIDIHERQRILLNNIVQINRDKELLSAKMRIHDELGECLLGTQKALQEGTIGKDHSQLSELWLETLENLGNIPKPAEADRTEAELLNVSRMIGCEVHFIGTLPDDYNVRQLIYAAVREALMNAVCHAKADQLNVKIENTKSFYNIRISDNGNQPVHSIREGVGLTGLRKRIEQDGASLQIECEQGVVLILQIPKESVLK